ncbi:hypothetical protein PRIPAC_97615, partial [Pristionchus pacificus]|uniref:Anillin homology domain-containing protein n=1 Tax=Pristionchus pacificus TaxID=54126 RepID=A0A8R1V2B8_PRIPA
GEESYRRRFVMLPGKAQCGVSQISIPLAWNREQHFKHRGECRTFSMFVTIRCGEEMIDSKLITGVDRTHTDVNFNESFVFTSKSDDFCLEIDLFAARTDDIDASGGSIAQRITRSLGRKLGQSTKQKLTVGEEALKASLHTAPHALGSTQFNLLARAQLAISDAGDESKVHDLKPRAFADLCGPPLYGSIVCRLVVQPQSVISPIADGTLTVMTEDQRRIHQLVRSILQSGRLRCFSSETGEMVLDIVLNAGTKLARTSRNDEIILTTSTSAYGEGKRYYIKTAEDAINSWHAAFEQQISDCVAWGVFAYSTHMLTKEKRPGPETLSRTAGKRFYDQVDINGTLPRHFGGTANSSYLMQLASSSFSQRNSPASVLSLGSTNVHHTAPARRTVLRPSVINVFNEHTESDMMPRSTAIGPPQQQQPTPNHYLHPQQQPALQQRPSQKSPLVSSPSPKPYKPKEGESSSPLLPTARAVYYEPAVHSIYGTDARRYTPVYERRKIEHAARLFEHPSPQVSPLRTVTEETPADNDDKFVIRLTVGDEDVAGNPARHDSPHDSRKSALLRDVPTIVRSPSPAAAYVPQPKPRAKYALRHSASERDARHPSDFFRDSFPNQIQITRL